MENNSLVDARMSHRFNMALDFGRDLQPELYGRLLNASGMLMEVVGIRVSIGNLCWIKTSDEDWLECEVVGFRGDRTLLMAVESMKPLKPGAPVKVGSSRRHILFGDGLIGRVVDGFCRPIDGLGELERVSPTTCRSESVNPMLRRPVSKRLDVGVRCINALCTLGEGQRLGLLAGSGVGKSVLLSMMARFTEADVVVVGLIGERGREVREFIQDTLGPGGLKKSVVVACPADQSPLMRVRSAELASEIAIGYRDCNKKVLLLMDSLTRYAQALREIGLAVGEPPTTKGYPPSVFAKLPALVEKAGNNRQELGSITAIYTVLAEGDDLQDPIVDAARSILDGHIVLSRSVAESGRYPAIDVSRSVSRVMMNVVSKEQLLYANFVKSLLSSFDKNRDLINIGAYALGSDALTDAAIEYMVAINGLLAQAQDEGVTIEESVKSLTDLYRRIHDRPSSDMS